MALTRIADDRTVQAIATLAADYPGVSVRKVLLSIDHKHVRKKSGGVASGNTALQTTQGVKL